MAKSDRTHYRRHPTKEQHGLSKTREHACWQRMLNRCYLKTHTAYEHYGGRGIVVCDQWRHSFSTFIRDMGQCPSGMSLDRIDTNGNYEPNNCRWADKPTQMRNRRMAVMLTFRGKTQNLSLWSAELGLPSKMLRHRIERGWSIEKTLGTPVLSTWSRR